MQTLPAPPIRLLNNKLKQYHFHERNNNNHFTYPIERHICHVSEIALISARKSSLNTDAKKGSKAKLALKLANEPDRFLSTIQIGITLIGILTGIYSGATLTDDFSVILKNWGVSPLYASLIAQGLIVVAVT